MDAALRGAATTRSSGWRRTASSRRTRRKKRRQKPIVTARRAVGAGRRSRRFSSKKSASISKRATAPSALYESGLSVQTALDLELQEAANRALDDGLAPPRQAARLPQARSATSSPRGTRIETSRHRALGPPDGGRRHRAGRRRPTCRRRGDRSCARARSPSTIDDKGLRLDAQDVGGAARHSRAISSKPRLLTLDDTAAHGDRHARTAAARRGRAARDRQPHRPDQARWSAASASSAASSTAPRRRCARWAPTFKPIVYTAAIDRGYTPTSIIIDAPVDVPCGPGQPPYSPQNYDRKFEGPITLRRALEDSRNVPAVQLMDAARAAAGHRLRPTLRPRDAAPAVPVDRARRGARPRCIEMTSAYSVFPNQGVRMQPVLDPQGRPTARATCSRRTAPSRSDAIRADTAFVMTNLLRGVVQRGTAAQGGVARLAARAARPARPTTTPTRGSSGSIRTSRSACGSGYDEKKPLGPNETGAEAALPIWMDIMKAYIGDRQGARRRSRRRATSSSCSVDKGSGEVADAGSRRGDHRSVHRRHAARLDEAERALRSALIT